LKRFIVLATILTMITLLLLGGISFAKVSKANGSDKMSGDMKTGGSMMMGGKWWQNPDVAKKLNITNVEKTTLDNLYVEKMKSMIDCKANLQKDMLGMQELLESDNLDEAKAMAAFKEYHDATDAMSAEHFKYLLEVRKLLGASRFKELKSSYNCFMSDGMGKGKGKKGMNCPMQ